MPSHSGLSAVARETVRRAGSTSLPAPRQLLRGTVTWLRLLGRVGSHGVVDRCLCVVIRCLATAVENRIRLVLLRAAIFRCRLLWVAQL
jgi:hypothetical protein